MQSRFRRLPGGAPLSRDEPVAQRPAASTGTSQAVLATTYALVSLFGLWGLSFGSVPFAVDLPNHAARLFIECNIGDPILARMYSVEYDLIPNLAIDLINGPLCGLVDPMTVVRGSMIAAVAGILIVVWKLHRLLHGSANSFVLLAPAMTFNIITGMGYLNYLIGTFLFLLFAWAMFRFRLLERHWTFQIIIPNLFGVLLFVCHIFALGLAGVFLFGLRFASGKGQPFVRRLTSAGLMSAASFAVPLLMVLLVDRSGVGVTYELAGKVRALWAPMLYSSMVLAAALVFVWFALFLWAFRETHVTFAPPARLPLVLLALFAFLLPSALLDAVDLDSRSLVSVAYFAIAAIGLRDPSRTGTRSTAELAAAAVAFATVGLQFGVALPKMLLFERQVAEFRAAISVLKPLDRVIAVADLDREPSIPTHFYAHLTSYATRDRRAFNPSEFTGKGMQPLHVQPEFACIDVPAGRPLHLRVAEQLLEPATEPLLLQDRYINLRYAYRWDRKFDYVVFYHFGTPANPFAGVLDPVYHGSFFSVLRTRKASGPAAASVC
jgi:hypothetical protein